MSYISRPYLVSLLSEILLVLMFNSCNSSDFDYQLEAILNPNKISPLTAQFRVTVEKPSHATFTVLGTSPITQSFDLDTSMKEVPIVGLYPNTLNKVLVTFDYDGGQKVDTINVQTGALPRQFPRIEINKLDRSAMESGLHGCDIHFANHGKFQSIPIIFDDQGQVRWYLDLSFHGSMVSPFQRLKDGTLLMVGRHTIYEFDMLGKLLKQSEISTNYGMHHDVLELPDGSLLICVGKRNEFMNLNGVQTQSDSDFMIHYDRKNSKVSKEWDLAKHLDVSRDALSFFREGDWLHMNALAFDEKDSTIIVSARNQGLIKVSWADELKWIMAPKKGWGRSGRQDDGFDTRAFLLTAVNAEGKPYSKAVQNGDKSAADFDFSWGPHAPLILANGNHLVFDNGSFRNYNNNDNYSRVVEYKVDETNKTVTQVWQYGKERGHEFFSSIVSDVDFLPNTNNILTTSGFLNPMAIHSAKIVETNYPNGEEVFEATLYFKSLNSDKKPGWGQKDILYRSERLKLKN